mgnify:CR=1 FL=1
MQFDTYFWKAVSSELGDVRYGKDMGDGEMFRRLFPVQEGYNWEEILQRWGSKGFFQAH